MVPSGSRTRAPAVIATATPARPGTAALAREPATMYSAQNAAETSASATPTRSSPPLAAASVAASVAVGQAQGEDAEQGEHDPGAVAPAARQRGREGERAEELDRHRRAERQPGEGGVVEPVHPGQADAVEDDGPPLRFAPAAHAGPGDARAARSRRAPRRSRVAPTAPVTGNRRVASAAPNWKDVHDPSTSSTAVSGRPVVPPLARGLPGVGTEGGLLHGAAVVHTSTVTDVLLVRPAMVFGQ